MTVTQAIVSLPLPFINGLGVRIALELPSPQPCQKVVRWDQSCEKFLGRGRSHASSTYRSLDEGGNRRLRELADA